MPDESGEKTELPTARKLQEARESGQVAKSSDLSAAVGLIGSLVLLQVFGAKIFTGLGEIMRRSLMLDRVVLSARDSLRETVHIILSDLFMMLTPYMLFLCVVAVAVNIAQTGFMASTKSIVPSFSKVSPLQGIKRLFSMKTTVRFLMSLLKVGVIGYIAYDTISDYISDMLGLTLVNYTGIISVSAEMMLVLGFKMCFVLLFLAVIDFSFQKYQLTQDLMMTKEEVKEEMKKMEGDPLMKQRRRNIAREMAMKRMSQAVPSADVIITNPTHLAIALKYDQDNMNAPKVVAKGAGFMAARIREIANEHGIPMVERKPLARSLYKACEVGDFVPEDLYKAVAEVLAYVFELAGKGFRRTPQVH